MSINYHSAACLIAARRRGAELGKVITLGRLHLSFTPDEARRLERAFDFPAGEFVTGDADERYCEGFLTRLGAESVTSLDVSDYQGASLRHDLNEPLPDDWKEGFDLVVDGGTLEHVFHATVAIRNAMELLRVGGRYLGAGPANNWLGHGFYQFSPEWYYRIFTAENGFEVEHVLLAEHGGARRVFRVDDPADTGVRVGLRSACPVETIALARRVERRPIFAQTPQQSDYSARWSEGSDGRHDGPRQPSALRALAKRVLPASLVLKLQEGAIARRHASEAARGLHPLDSYRDLA